MPRTEARECADVGLETCCRDLADQFCDVGIRGCRYVGGIGRTRDERECRRGGERQQAMKQAFHLVQIRIFADQTINRGLASDLARENEELIGDREGNITAASRRLQTEACLRPQSSCKRYNGRDKQRRECCRKGERKCQRGNGCPAQ